MRKRAYQLNFFTKQSYFIRRNTQGFALPTLLIAATVMLIMLLSAVQSAVSTSESISSQYTAKLAKSAADSGLAMARACLIKNGVVSWSSASQLKPNSNCAGVNIVAGGCPRTSTNSACYVMLTTGYRTTFSVGVVYDGSNPRELSSQGIVEELRTTSGTPVNQSTYTMKAILGSQAGVFNVY